MTTISIGHQYVSFFPFFPLFILIHYLNSEFTTKTITNSHLDTSKRPPPHLDTTEMAEAAAEAGQKHEGRGSRREPPLSFYLFLWTILIFLCTSNLLNTTMTNDPHNTTGRTGHHYSVGLHRTNRVREGNVRFFLLFFVFFLVY
jgi:hypothetical protein